ncbi:MAG TPA: GMP synthase [Deltaproteobacteria bacterium]|nr:MAG: hypothetical protein A2Z79_00135 [Deltaproteobacteria bacterium GWA2_55_82]OGQ64956.1 MAG: hypothetical protein A3I81_01735 [Deltaproteobacteria bacterium RIFCSPLOWO2_02_FULL_55_12]OIJ73864.1 MAG: hypothetical protein A2V21_306040 [Deltaproteobacteria bacterium GWC2_55_46]HBG46319.1 GMP synthase [Deltaproteobacteria bacterium]HCY09851.1 GMP synthase [Deltaproteobacteria bacterium]
MPRALVIRHVRHEGLGTIKRPLEKDFMVEYFDMFKGAVLPSRIDGYDALIVMGGPMGVYEEDKYPFIKDELRLIESALKERVPTLGICLGSQLLAKAAGADVYKGKAKEIGWYKVALEDEGIGDRLFIGFPEEFTVFQWHGDTFDVPPGAVRLASSEFFPNQVIKVGPAAYGVQFHLEVTEEMIRDWIGVNGEELSGLKGKIDPQEILKKVPENIEGLHRLASPFVARFLRMAEK